ncbi:hypothetical protein B0H13DRAFT_2002936 [Mycena leptocephala]|nr:hypothetical protein B0H13DRAFT_2002936 [Mycena leptocephala]
MGIYRCPHLALAPSRPASHSEVVVRTRTRSDLGLARDPGHINAGWRTAHHAPWCERGEQSTGRAGRISARRVSGFRGSRAGDACEEAAPDVGVGSGRADADEAQKPSGGNAGTAVHLVSQAGTAAQIQRWCMQVAGLRCHRTSRPPSFALLCARTAPHRRRGRVILCQQRVEIDAMRTGGEGSERGSRWGGARRPVKAEEAAGTTGRGATDRPDARTT